MPARVTCKHNVLMSEHCEECQDYPNLLLTTGRHDSQVQYSATFTLDELDRAMNKVDGEGMVIDPLPVLISEACYESIPLPHNWRVWPRLAWNWVVRLFGGEPKRPVARVYDAVPTAYRTDQFIVVHPAIYDGMREILEGDD